MKSMMRRPSENLPVGRLKKVSPYGGEAAVGGVLGGERRSRLPVSASESPKLIMDLKHAEEDCRETRRMKKVRRILGFEEEEEEAMGA